jgi:hypothetical protein
VWKQDVFDFVGFVFGLFTSVRNWVFTRVVWAHAAIGATPIIPNYIIRITEAKIVICAGYEYSALVSAVND